MTDAAPDNPLSPFVRLPDDVDALGNLRDQLGDYLSTLERNTDAANAWLAAHADDIIVGLHRLDRAVSLQKDDAAAQKILTGMGDVAHFVLSLQDFKAQAEAALGKDSALLKDIEKIQPGFPPRVLEDLPAVDTQFESLPDLPDGAEAVEPEKKKKGFFSFFKKEEPQESSEEKAATLRRHWTLVRNELTGLQSDRHYYVDAFMEWVGDTLEPEGDGPAVAALMQKYQDPQYIIDLALRDYAEVTDIRARAVKKQAEEYAALAGFLDRQEIEPFILIGLPALFHSDPPERGKHLLELLKEDFGIASIADFALHRVPDRGQQLALLTAALDEERSFVVAGARKHADIFEEVLSQVLSDSNPLPPLALKIALLKLREADDNPEKILNLGDEETPFSRIARRFKDDYKEMDKALDALLTGAGDKQGARKAHTAVEFARARDERSYGRMAAALQKINDGAGFMALHHLCWPGVSVVDSLVAASGPKNQLSDLVRLGLDAGILDEFRIGSAAADADAAKVFPFLDAHVVPPPRGFDPQTARRLLGFSFAQGGLDGLRKELTRKDGWLDRVVGSGLDTQEKLTWLSVLLEPFPSDVAKANILFEASQNTANTNARDLRLLEENLIGRNIRLDDDQITLNLGRIANIWYNDNPGMLRYTVDGTGHTLANDVSPAEASELLSLLARRGGFEREAGGVFHPENIDRIVTDERGTKVRWSRHTGDLNVTAREAAALHARPDFLHNAEAGHGHATTSVNIKNITLLQPLSDGTHLLIDGKGNTEILKGRIDFSPQLPFINIAGTGAWFNPENASVICLDEKENALDFRIESREFDESLDQIEPGKYFYRVKLPDYSGVTGLESALEQNAAIVPAGTNGPRKHLYFNLRALSYLSFEQGPTPEETGFRCHQHGPVRKPGFIRADADLARSTMDMMRGRDDIIVVGSTALYVPSVDNAYHNDSTDRLCVLSGQDMLQIPCDVWTAKKALEQLGKTPGFCVVGVKKATRFSDEDMPADIINISHATMLGYSRGPDKAFFTMDADNIPASLSHSNTFTLIRRLEEIGLADARAHAAKGWHSLLQRTSAGMRKTSVSFFPPLTEKGTAYLLDRALGKPEQEKESGNMKKEFGAAARALKARDTLEYPVKRKKSSAHYKSRKKHRPFY